MSEEIAKNKRQAATGLGLKVKPLEIETENLAERYLEEAIIVKERTQNAGGKSNLPLISKPIFREASVSARTTSDNKRQLEDLAKISGRSVSYLVSELLDAVLPEWIEIQKAHYEKSNSI